MKLKISIAFGLKFHCHLNEQKHARTFVFRTFWDFLSGANQLLILSSSSNYASHNVGLVTLDYGDK